MFYTIGKLVNTHGLKGTVKIKPFTDFLEERFDVGSRIFIEHKGEKFPVIITSYRLTKGLVYVTFEQFDDINDIAKYKGSTLYVHEDDLHTLKEDEFYVRDLVGIKVFTDTLIGEVVDVYTHTNDDILVVKRSNAKNALIPFRDAFIKDVDLEARQIVIKEIEGLL
ncbi:MAG: ribosome maturation factor RimM [Candidatus Izemoplasma sp.]|nr:ribosome maturation factor RimM [Candidatus Izemoplasma sp.]